MSWSWSRDGKLVIFHTDRSCVAVSISFSILKPILSSTIIKVTHARLSYWTYTRIVSGPIGFSQECITGSGFDYHPTQTISTFNLSATTLVSPSNQMSKLVKICGLRTTEAASKAVESGADMLGVIMVPNRKRTVSHSVAKEISLLARQAREQSDRRFKSAAELVAHVKSQNIDDYNQHFELYHQLLLENGPFLLGVFRNQNIDQVFELAEQCRVDCIQLHGSEDVTPYLERNSDGKYLIVKRYVIPDQIEEMTQFFTTVCDRAGQGFAFPLLDSEAGGEGQTIDWTLINDLKGKFVLAGGLKPDNLDDTIPYSKNVFGFDVSGGVEDANGDKNLDKIEQFVRNAKSI